MGNWSEWFMLLAAMTYMVAFVAFVWDMATHSKTLAVKERSRAAKQAAAERKSEQLVGAGAGAAGGSSAAGSAGAVAA
ncbi:cytochrome C biogenesis protein, partial [Kocuria rhizophila]